MNSYTIALAILFLYFSIFFLIAQRLRNNSIVDIGWGTGFVFVAWATFLTHLSFQSLLIPILVSIWGLRLTSHIYRRNHGKPEDFRYVAMRKRWGNRVAINAFFKVFMLQGVLLYIVSLAVIGAGSALLYPLFGIFGLLLWGIGFYFEAVGDKQLKDFLKVPANKGHVIQTGLWRLTRHPNYFGEAVLWWGLFLIAIGFGAPLFSIIAPITIHTLVRFVSGVPLLEKRYAGNSEYQAYALETPIFTPFLKK